MIKTIHDPRSPIRSNSLHIQDVLRNEKLQSFHLIVKKTRAGILVWFSQEGLTNQPPGTRTHGPDLPRIAKAIRNRATNAVRAAQVYREDANFLKLLHAVRRLVYFASENFPS